MTRLRALAAVVALVAAFPGHDSRAAADVEPTWNIERVAAPGAWGRATGRNVVVAVVDSGLDWRHGEFGAGNPRSPKIVAPASCLGAPSPKQCSPEPSAWLDRNGHGTHVSGIIAAPLNGRGVVGVAPDARIMPVRVLDGDATGTARDVAAGIRYAVAHRADVINLSVSGLPVVSQLSRYGVLDPALVSALDEAADAGILVVAAAGNDLVPLCSHKLFQSDEGLCVGATDRRDVKAPYSNFGAGLDLVAPGGAAAALCSEGVLSTDLVQRSSTCGPSVPGYGLKSGTSMAAPHVAGAGALLVEAGMRGRAAARRLVTTAVDLGPPGTDRVYGHGRVDARRAVMGATSSGWRPLSLS